MDRAEVPLAGDEQVPDVPPLGQPGQGRIDRVVAVRVVPLHRLADDPRALAGRPARIQVEVAHRRQDPALRGLEAVADVGQRPADDDRHRVIEVTLLELVFDIQRRRRQVVVTVRCGGAHKSIPLVGTGVGRGPRGRLGALGVKTPIVSISAPSGNAGTARFSGRKRLVRNELGRGTAARRGWPGRAGRI